MVVLDTTIANVALKHIAGSLGASADESTWIVTSYLASNAIVLPISGWLSNVIGRKRFYMLCVALFTIASVMCSFATSLGFMVIMRIVQGIGGGGLAPTEQSMLADTFPPEKRAQAFALYGLTAISAPAIGPVLGGWLTDAYSWHWVFLINLPFGLLSLALVFLFVDEPAALKRDREKLFRDGFKIDYLGFVLIAVGFGSMQIVLDKFERADGFDSPLIFWLSVTCVVSLSFLVLWEWQHPKPAVDLRMLQHRNFAICSGLMFLVGLLMNTTTQLQPQLAQDLLGYDATQAGMTLAIGGVVTVILMPFAGIASGRFAQPKYLLAGGLIVTGLAMLHFSDFSLQVSFWQLSLARAFQVAALPFLFVPLTAAAYVGIPADKSNEASAISNLTRNLGGSIGVAMVTTMLARRGQFHHAKLADHVTAYSHWHGRSLAQMGHAIQAQASIMSYLDIFWLLGVVALVLSPVALLLRTGPKNGAAAHGH